MLNIFFPRLCNGCQGRLLKHEELICTRCRHELPLACFHKFDDPFMLNLFYGRIPVNYATSLIHFQKKGITQELMHNLKYRKQEALSSFFGKWLGADLSEHSGFRSVDLVVPVPLDRKKLKQRGYNQVSGFGSELAKALQVPFREDVLIKESAATSQVFKKRVGRFESDALFKVQNQNELNQRHVLLVDDIVTTGATLEKCALELLKAKDVQLSIATIAVA